MKKSTRMAMAKAVSYFASLVLSHHTQGRKCMRQHRQIQALAVATQLSQTDPGILHRPIYFCPLSRSGSLAYVRTLCFFHAAAAADNDADATFNWNAMIRGCTQSPHVEDAFLLYRQILRRSGKPDSFTYSFVMNACAASRKFETGRQIHGQVLRLGFVSDIFVMNNLLQLYLNCQGAEVALQVFGEMAQPDVVSYNTIIRGCFLDGFVENARQLFEGMPARNLVSWSTVLTGYKRLGCHFEVLSLFSEFLLVGQPDSYIVATALSACASLCSLESGKQIHSYVFKFESLALDGFVLNGVVHMYAYCGSVHVARKIFDGMTHLHAIAWNALIAGYARLGFLEEAHRLLDEMRDKDVISWSALISACLQSGFYQEALMVYREMRSTNVRPNEITIVSVLSSCTKLVEVLEGEKIHAHVIKCGLEDDILHNSLIHFYSGCGLMDKALKLFKRDKTKAVGWCSLVVGFCRCGLVDQARRLFNRMPERDAVSWNAMISGYTQSGRLSEAFELFTEMQKTGTKPDDATFLSLILGCTGSAALRQGKSLHAHMQKTGIELKCNLAAAVVDMYAHCGSMESALGTFHRLEAKTSSVWNALIRGLALNGRERDALNAFKEMQLSGVAPDGITFLALLTACRHSGWLDAAWLFFNCMITVHGIEPSLAHYGCMVDLLGHAGSLVEAEKLIASMPMKPGISTWGALLLACRNHGNVEVGERVLQRILELEPGNTGCPLLLANAFAEAGEWERAADVRKRMEVRGGPRTPGSSSIHVGNEVHEFMAGCHVRERERGW